MDNNGSFTPTSRSFDNPEDVYCATWKALIKDVICTAIASLKLKLPPDEGVTLTTLSTPEHNPISEIIA